MKRPKPIKRYVPLKRVSKRRQRESRTYSALRKDFLAARPVCEVCGVRPSTEVHHKARRGSNYLNVATWAAVCWKDHDRIETEPLWARANGWLI